MEKKLLVGILAIFITTVSLINVNFSQDNMSLLHLRKTEALAQWAGGWKPDEKGGGALTFGYKMAVESYDVYIFGRLTTQFRNVCKTTIEIGVCIGF